MIEIIVSDQEKILDYIVRALHEFKQESDLLPSEQDRKITKAIKNALELFSVSVNDHIILSADGHYSFLDMGVL